MKIKEILRGTKEELIEHFSNLIENTKNILKKDNYLYSREGMQHQIEKIIDEVNGTGTIFYMEIDKQNSDEINLVLRDCYISVEG